VVALVVPGSSTQTLSVNFSDVPGLGSGSFSWTEFYSGRTGSGTSVSATLGSHDIAVFKVIKSGTTTTAGPQSTTRTTTAGQATTTSNGGQCAAMWGQCGGSGWTVSQPQNFSIFMSSGLCFEAWLVLLAIVKVLKLSVSTGLEMLCLGNLQILK
jgi:hypothetical protein